MTASPIYQQLCCQLVEDYYGDFYATIFECLVASRRQASQIAQKCHLPGHQVKAGLAALVQLKLVYHHTTLDGPTLYSANLTNAYNIVRTGRLLQAAQDQYGELGARIMSIACDLGFASIGEIRGRVLQESSESSASVEDMIQDLVTDRFLTHLRKSHFSEPHDTRRAAETAIMSRAEIAKLAGSRAKGEFALRVESRLDEQLNTSVAETGHVNESWKQEHRNGIHTNGHARGSGRSTLVQPNYHKVVALTQALVASEMVKKLHGSVAGDVVACAVQKVVDVDAWSQLSANAIVDINTNALRDEYNRYIQQREAAKTRTLANGIDAIHHNAANGVNGHSERERPITNGHSFTDLSVRDINRELLFLSEGTISFLSGSNDSWMIAKDQLDKMLKEEETLRVMDSRMEEPAPRILRILIEKGKLEERTLQEIALLGAKELRQTLSALKQVGYLDLQEVPRNNQRMPNQTTFLWSHEANRVHHLVLEHTYAGISKLLKMLQLERDKIAGTLTKIEREDVKGREKDSLAEAEYIVWQRFCRIEAWVWGEIHRMDMTVAILRDT